MEALEIYNSLSKPPQDALRTIEAGKLKGKTDINPQWRYKAMTETFGLVGIGWKYEIQKLWTEPGAANEVLAFAQVAVYVFDNQTAKWSDAIVGIGGSKLVNAFKNGLESNDEGFKMAVTDAFSTSLKMLGVAADIYAGKWDGSKYKNEQDSPASVPQNKRGPAPQEPVPHGPKGGMDTPEERNEINTLLGSKKADGSAIFTQQDIARLGDMRMQKTAAEVIAWLKAEITNRRQAPAPAPQSQQEELPIIF